MGNNLEYKKGLTRGNVRTDPALLKAKARRANPDVNNGLGVAKVVEVNYEEFRVQLRIVVGTSETFEPAPVAITVPGAGARHFLGAMPCIGDYCVVGWMPHETGVDKSNKKTPVILAWITPGTWVGRDWATTAPFTVNEYAGATPKDRAPLHGAMNRVRHKLRHAQPGDIVASSAKGADLVLDEGVTLANRRGNEIRLRDQDQALIVRTLQQFHAMAGARLYAGMVQRDATLLAPALVSDGKEWDAKLQSVDRDPVHETELPSGHDIVGMLTPARPFGRTPDKDGHLGIATADPSPGIDPYQFLRRGGFLDAGGHVVDGRHEADAMYGGKPIFRVAAQTGQNATIDPNAPTLTEWRLEVAHTSDGRLPVTEQTDMLDAERLPRVGGQAVDPSGLSPNVPFIEVIYGSVVGNDPYSTHGRVRYGLPLQAIMFDGDDPAPRLDPVRLVGGNGDATPLGDHAATLFRLSPRVSPSQGDTFWSVSKSGQLKAAIGGPSDGNSIEAALTGGLKLAVGGELALLLDGPVRLRSRGGAGRDNVGLDLGSDTGAVRIFGGGAMRGPEAATTRAGGSESSPSVHVNASHDARIEAGRRVQVRGQRVDVSAPAVSLQGHQTVEIIAADRLSTSAKVVDATYGGKHVETYAGPKDALPSNGPLHEVTYAPGPFADVSQKSTFVRGDREEEFLQGSHQTSLKVGDATYALDAGTFAVRAGKNDLSVAPGHVRATAKVGPVSLEAVAGSATLSGSTSVRITTTGTASIDAPGGVAFNTIVDNNQGAVICSGTLEPLSGLPFATWGLGAQRVRVGLSI